MAPTPEQLRDAYMYMVRGYVWYDDAAQAHLSASHGRTKWGDTKYVLVIGKGDTKIIKRFRCYSEAEAIQKAQAIIAKHQKGGQP